MTSAMTATLDNRCTPKALKRNLMPLAPTESPTEESGQVGGCDEVGDAGLETRGILAVEAR